VVVPFIRLPREFQAERNTTCNQVLQVARPGELAASREQAGG